MPYKIINLTGTRHDPNRRRGSRLKPIFIGKRKLREGAYVILTDAAYARETKSISRLLKAKRISVTETMTIGSNKATFFVGYSEEQKKAAKEAAKPAMEPEKPKAKAAPKKATPKKEAAPVTLNIAEPKPEVKPEPKKRATRARRKKKEDVDA